MNKALLGASDAVLNALPLPVIMVAADGKIADANVAAARADRADHEALRGLHPAARTTLCLVVGACACDLVRQRGADRREDERHHRERHQDERDGEPVAVTDS